MADKPYQDADWLSDAYDERPVIEIAEDCDVSPKTIYHWLDKLGIDTSDKFHPSDTPYRDKEWLKQRWEDAASVQEIADEAGADPSTITEWAQRHGLPSFYDAKPWNDESVLRELYHGEKMSHSEIADELGCAKPTVAKNMKKLGIETRGVVGRYHASNPACQFYTHPDGYEFVASERKGVAQKTALHQLLAVAEGADPEKVWSGDYHVHHKNRIPWDNRPENIELLHKSDHARLHQEDREQTPN